MSCYGCGSGFSAFKKEHGCKNCGFSFCMKCLPNKLGIPKLNNEKHKVCLKCYRIMTGAVKPTEQNPAKYSPPENYKKRVAALQEREKSGATPGLHGAAHPPRGQGQARKPAGMSQADWDIQERLQKLRADNKPAVKVSNEEIDNRLANLKGMDPARYKAAQKPKYQAPDRRTQQEQVNDLLDEIGDEVELDSHLPDPVTEIEKRLAELRQPAPNIAPEKKTQESSEENDLNKASLRDSQSFSCNIDSSSKDSNPATNSVSSPEGKPTVGGGDDEISPEEVTRILSETAHTLEEDARKALKGLEEDKEIMKRIQEVKQRRKQSTTDINKDEALSTSDSENEDDDDDKLTARLIKQALEEAKLDMAAAEDGVAVEDQVSKKRGKSQESKKKSNVSSPTEDNDEWYDPDELPYCCICTEDATVRCLGCDRDIYCDLCFREGHQELGMTDHVTLKYTAPKENT